MNRRVLIKPATYVNPNNSLVEEETAIGLAENSLVVDLDQTFPDTGEALDVTFSPFLAGSSSLAKGYVCEKDTLDMETDLGADFHLSRKDAIDKFLSSKSTEFNEKYCQYQQDQELYIYTEWLWGGL